MELLIWSLYLASIVLQLAAVVFALRMLNGASVKGPWVLLACGLVMMALGRALRMMEAKPGDAQSGWLTPESTAVVLAAMALIISILFCLALLSIRRLSDRERVAAAAQKQSEQRLTSVIDNMPSRIFIKDLLGRHVLVNKPFLDGLGLSADQVLGQTDNVLYPPEIAARFHVDDDRVLGERMAKTQEARITVQGQTHIYLTTKFPVFDDAGRVSGVCGISTDVTALRAAEASIRESEQRLRLGMEAGNVGTWAWDLVANRISWSDRIYAFHGLTRDEFDGSANAFTQLIHPEDRDGVMAAVQEAITQGKPYAKDYRVVHRDGSVRWLTTTGQVFLGPDGKPNRMMGATSDVTEKKRLTDELHESQRFVKRVLETTPDLVYVFDLRDQRLTYRNREFRAFLGHGPTSTVPEDGYVEAHLHPEDAHVRERINERFASIADGEVREIEFRIRHADGTYHWMAARETVFNRDPDGTVRQVLGTAEDVTPRRLAEAERDRLLASEKLARAQAEAAAEREAVRSQQLVQIAAASLAASASGLSVNAVCDIVADRARNIIGAHQAMAVLRLGDDWSQVIHTVHLSDKYSDFRGLSKPPGEKGVHVIVCEQNRPLRLTREEKASHPLRSPTPMGPPMLGYLAAPLIGRDGQNLGLIQLSDKYQGEFTAEDEAILVQLASVASSAMEAARLLDEARAARAEAEAANTAKDRFLAVLSHELRTPLSPVLMSVTAMEQEPSLPQALRDELSMVRRNIDLEVRLIDDLLDLSRVRNGKLRINPTPTNVHKLLGHVRSICADDIESKRLTLEFDLSATFDTVQGDPARLQQVFWNLLKNAVKFTPDGQAIRVHTRNPDPDRIEIFFTDKGIGIPPDVLSRLFDAFEQGNLTDSRQFGGLGLGLAISKAIVEMHHGQIHAQSEGVGKGAAFIVNFPLVKDSTDHTAPEAPPTDGQSRKLRLLVVEDHADTAKVLARLLQLKGYEVKTAHSVGQALETVAAEKFDVLISDIGLPDADGYELMKQIRATQNLKGIAMSGYGMDEDVQKSREAGFSEHVVKPVNVSQLEEALRRVVGDH